MLTGTFAGWSRGGKLRAEGNFKANWLDGWYREYDATGKATFEKFYKDGFEEDPPEEEPDEG
mgnify:CR=1 FL=1